MREDTAMIDISEGSKIAEFYKGQTLFITGASGFMGKVLLEKILYACPGIVRIYILVRPKRGKSPKTRLEEMAKLPLFHRVHKERPHAFEKVVLVNGDVTMDDLGLSSEDRTLLEKEVTVVFHGAATLRLEAILKDAVEMNLNGTWRILQLCKKMSRLKVLVHLSTAFCHCDYEELEEKMYPCSVNPHDVMRCCQWMDPAMLESITPSLISPHPNTYTFSKRLAEILVANEHPNLPVVIARPSIVTPAWREPLPGWVDNLNGPVGLMVAAGKGVVRSMHIKGEYHSEVIPVDFAINGLLMLAAKVGYSSDRPKEVPVYNLTASAVKKMTWKEVLDIGRRIIYDYPFEMTVWYPDGNIRANKFMHNMCVIFLHFLPAYLIDFLMLIFFQKPFMVHIHKRIQNGMLLLQYFTTRRWVFHSSKFLALGEDGNQVDKGLFSIDFSQMVEEQYLKDCLLGGRQYCMKEPLSSLPRCRRILKVLYVVDKLWSIFFYGLLLWLVYLLETARYVLDTATEYIRTAPVIRTLAKRSDF